MSVLRRHKLLFATLFVALATLATFGGWWWHGSRVIDAELATRWPASWAMRADWEVEHPMASVEHRPVPLASVAPELVGAVLAGEDVGYFVHGPFDLGAIREALTQYLDGARLRGASTITQQLAKNLYLSPRRSFWRKLEEARLAYWLEHELGKRRVLALYLNLVELGPGIYGVEAASRHYFGIGAGAVSRAQAVDLAATIPSPQHDNPATRTAGWRRRRETILGRLARFPYLVERFRPARLP